MEYLAAGLSSLMSVFVLAVFVAGVMKVFQIHTVLLEIRDKLATGRTAAPAYSAPAPSVPVPIHSMASGDEMLRALDAQMKWDETESRSETR